MPRATTKGRNTDFDRRDYQLDAEASAICLPRFGVACKSPQTGELSRLYEGYEASDRASLNLSAGHRPKHGGRH